MFAVFSRLHMFHSQKGRKYSKGEGKKIVLEQLCGLCKTSRRNARRDAALHATGIRFRVIKFNKEAETSRLSLQEPKTQLEPQL